MTTPSLQTVREHIRLIVTPIVWDAGQAAAVQAQVEAWVVDNADTITAAPLAFTADCAVTASLDAVSDLMASDPPDTARVALARRLAGASSAGRVAVALHELCGHDIAATAELSLRGVDDVRRLLNLTLPGPGAGSDLELGPHDQPPAPTPVVVAAPLPGPLPAPLPEPLPGPPAVTTAGSIPPSPPDTGVPDGTLPGGTPPASEEAGSLGPQVLAPPALAPPPPLSPPAPSHDQGTPGRARPPRMVRLSTVVILSVVFGLIWVITRGGGERPSFASEVTPNSLADDNSQVITAGRGCDGPTGLAIGSPSTRSVRLSGLSRPYRVFLPSRYQQGQRLPLVIDLGDFGQSADQRAASSGWEDLSEEQSFITVTGEPGGSFPQWNVTSALAEMDDVEYLDSVIGDLFELACVDPARVWISGHGDGGLMAAAYTCVRPTQVAAIAVVGGVFVPSGCSLEQPVSLLAVHRADDDLFPLEGGIGPAIDPLTQNRSSLTESSAVDPESIAQSVATWAALSGCDLDAGPEGSAPERTAYQGCDGGAAVELRTFAGGGHPWTADDLAAAYTFFRDHAKASR